ncbi:MAG: hypothetical protein DLM61_18525 [Pseudonocardiales bacterium]|nr:MAG: hypothetical protein DLM61_18525 [Pseudonocardiales bacterium]
MAEQMSLHGSGPRTRAEWVDLVASLPDATAVWADLEGMHQTPLPDSMPVGATHLWFWDTRRHGRVRIDGETWVAGVLTEPETSAPAHCNAFREDGIVVDRVKLTAWAPAERRIEQFRGDREVLASFAQLVPRRPTTGVFLAAAGDQA